MDFTTKIGTVFQFEAPRGWPQFRDGSRLIFQGPNHEELIISASLVEGFGTKDDLRAVQKRLFQNAEQSVKNAAQHPSLKVTQPLRQNGNFSKLDCWTLSAQTMDGDTLFDQAIFRNPLGVLLVTFEAPNTINSTNAFKQFVSSVQIIER